MLLQVKGEASGVLTNYRVTEAERTLTLLQFLRTKSLPIASSCDGNQQCFKCLVNQNVLSCSLTIADFIQQHGAVVQVSYL